MGWDGLKERVGPFCLREEKTVEGEERDGTAGGGLYDTGQGKKEAAVCCIEVVRHGLKTGHIQASSRTASQTWLGRMPSEWVWRL